MTLLEIILILALAVSGFYNWKLLTVLNRWKNAYLNLVANTPLKTFPSIWVIVAAIVSVAVVKKIASRFDDENLD